MFFSTYVLTKKGPLAKVWLAAHWDRKLTKNEVKVVNLRETIVHIIRPVVPIAIRTSGELLIGVVRIYALKVKHLLREATEASLHLLMTRIAAKNGLTLERKEGGKALAHNKANVSAVTYEWGGATNDQNGEVAQRPVLTAGDAPFNEIADLLGGLSGVDGTAPTMAAGGDEENLLRSAWYAVEPVLQNDSHNTQEDLDDIARMRADLLAFGEQRGDSGSHSTSSKSKSSLSSIEQARGSHLFDDGVPFLPVTDELDIGVPLPDELPMDVISAYPGDGAENPFFIPDLLIPQAEGGTTAEAGTDGQPSSAAGSLPASRKVRLVNVHDLHATTLPREVVEKNMAERGDILERYGARHGAGTEVERHDRFTVIGGAPPATGLVAPPTAPSSSGGAAAARGKGTTLLQEAALSPLSMSVMASPLLRQRFTSAVAAAVSQLPSHVPTETAVADENEAFAVGGGGMPSEEWQTTTPLHDASAAAATTGGKKRSREERDDSGLSHNAAATLEKIKDLLEGRRRKVRRSGESAATLASPSCSLEELCESSQRREVARTFVDVLLLLSKQFITVEQERELGPLVVRLEPDSSR